MNTPKWFFRILISLVILGAGIIPSRGETGSQNILGNKKKSSSDIPHLVIESGGHLSIIRELIFTADGSELISVSDDKTIRVWKVAPDGRQATLTRTIYGQMEEGRAGALYGAALSPPDAEGKQRWLAVGGFLAGSEEERYAIRLHDYATGEVIALLQGHRDVINALAFSPTGRWLASVSKDTTVRIWDLSSLQGNRLTKPPLVLAGHTEPIYDVAWSLDGNRLASAAYDNTVGLWDTEQLPKGRTTLIRRLQGHTDQVRTVAFHPKEAVLLSGGKDQAIRLWRASDGISLGIFAQTRSKVAALAFSPDGGSVLAGSADERDIPERVSLYAYPSGKEKHLFRDHQNVVIATTFHPSGRWVASGGGNNKEILLWQPDTGTILTRLEGGGQTIWAVGFSQDGRFLSWGQTLTNDSIIDKGPLEHRFDLLQLTRLRGGLSPTDAVRARDRVKDLSLIPERGGPYNYTYRLRVERGSFFRQVVSTIDRDRTNGYRHSAYTFTPDGQYILSGGFNGTLTLYTLEGKIQAHLKGHTGEIKAVAVSADGRWALSGASDQTLRLWSLEYLLQTGSREITPALSLFPSGDGEWVAWIPAGFFTASPKGSQLIGYTINQGVDKRAKYVAIAQLYDRFYRPDLIHARLHGDQEKLWEKEGASQDVQTVLKTGLPPEVTFVSPPVDTTVTHPDPEIQVAFTDQGGGIGKILWKINGITVAIDTSIQASSSRNLGRSNDPSLLLTKQWRLEPGENTITVIAYNRQNEVASSPAVRVLTFTPPLLVAKEAPPTKELPLSSASSTSPSAPPPSPPQATAEKPPVQPGPRVKNTPPPSVPQTPAEPVRPSLEKPPQQPASPSPLTPAKSDKRELSLPNLYVLTIGINRYRDRALQLNYAVPDAQAIVRELRVISAPLFRQIIVTELLDEQATFAGIDAAFNRFAHQIETQDVFVLYMAGHGKTLDGRYYFLPQDFRYRSEDSIRKEAINQEHLQAWLASIPARKSLVMIDTCESGSFTQSLALLRGMAEKVAIEKLSRATGRATIVAATDIQPALEGYKGHGVFTYVLLQGLIQADRSHGNRDGIVGIYELAQYVDDQVPTITMQAFNFEQFPQVHMLGSDFPIGMVQMN